MGLCVSAQHPSLFPWGHQEQRLHSVLHYVTVFVHLLSLIHGSVPDLLALKSHSDIETCEEGVNSLRAILGPDVLRQRV